MLIKERVGHRPWSYEEHSVGDRLVHVSEEQDMKVNQDSDSKPKESRYLTEPQVYTRVLMMWLSSIAFV